MNYNNELRLIITSKCNYQCWFCHKEGINVKIREEEMTSEEIAFLFETYKDLTGNHNITLTGGEPCIRPDICDIIDLLVQKGAIITLTTNGTLLSKLTGREKYINKFNISFHSCNKEIYEKIVCKQDTFEKAKKALFDFRNKNPLAKISINCTVFNNINSDDKNFYDLIFFAEQLNASVKFIEMYPSYSQTHYSLMNKKNSLEEKNFEIKERLPRKIRYEKNNAKITLSTIFCVDAWKNNDVCNYCNKNNDLFIASNGEIKPCRESSLVFNIKNALEKKDTCELIKTLERSYLSLGSYCNIKKIPDNYLEIISLTKDFVKSELFNETTGHDYYHTIRVWACSKKLATNKNTNTFLLEMIALLHDIDDYKIKEINIAPTFLKNLGLHPMYIFHITNGINNISFSNNLNQQKKISLEEAIVQDADRIDALGAIGIARTFAYGGKVKRPIYDPEVKPLNIKTKQQYIDNKGTSINHFYEKLLLIPQSLNTLEAKSIAKERVEFIDSFLQQFYFEWNMTV